MTEGVDLPKEPIANIAVSTAHSGPAFQTVISVVHNLEDQARDKLVELLEDTVRSILETFQP